MWPNEFNKVKWNWANWFNSWNDWRANFSELNTKQLQRTIQQRQKYLQNISRSCQQARGEHEHIIATQTTLVEESNAIHEWLNRTRNDLSQWLEWNFSSNHLDDLQDTIVVRMFPLRFSLSIPSFQQWNASIEQRMARLDKALREELMPHSPNDQEIRDRLRAVESLKQEVKTQLNKRWSLFDDIQHWMNQYSRLTTEVKTAIW